MTATLAAQNLHRVCPDSVGDERVPEKALTPLCEGFTSPGPGYGLDVEQEQERVKGVGNPSLGEDFCFRREFLFFTGPKSHHQNLQEDAGESKGLVDTSLAFPNCQLRGASRHESEGFIQEEQGRSMEP